MRETFIIAVLLMSLAGNIDGINTMIKEQEEVKNRVKNRNEQYMIIHTNPQDNYC